MGTRQAPSPGKSSEWKPEYSERARTLWQEYEAEHDLASRHGKIAGIDPVSGRIWIGESAVDVAAQMEAEGSEAPVYLVRIGFDHFVHKGQR